MALEFFCRILTREAENKNSTCLIKSRSLIHMTAGSSYRTYSNWRRNIKKFNQISNIEFVIFRGSNQNFKIYCIDALRSNVHEIFAILLKIKINDYID